MSFSEDLSLIERRASYPGYESISRRWGQILREAPEIHEVMEKLVAEERLIPLSALGRVRSGVVSRANSYFIVRELPFDQIPKRFHVTKADHKRVTVVMDGLETPSKIERRFLRPIVKGPEQLLSPKSIAESDNRLFVVDDDKETLRRLRAQGAIDYLRRGETVSYSISEDSLKGGVPAKRSQVRDRKPYWYSLSIPDVKGPRILLPEHIDRRYICTLLEASAPEVVIDTLYTLEVGEPRQAWLILASLNTLLSWYQLEMRGRTQHGEGVLKVKIPDWSGVLVLNPKKISRVDRETLKYLFSGLSDVETTDSLELVGDANRVAFDEQYLRAIKWPKPAEARLDLEREVRAASGERRERKESVADLKVDRRRAQAATANVDALVARVCAGLEPYPNPLHRVPGRAKTVFVPVNGAIERPLTVGTELFDQGEVRAAGVCIARAFDMSSAQFVRAVLLHDPDANSVAVPEEPILTEVMNSWRDDVDEWEKAFAISARAMANAVADPRIALEINERARVLLHAE
jgi:hypothetical protein